jgi:hypothetical protein
VLRCHCTAEADNCAALSATNAASM